MNERHDDDLAAKQSFSEPDYRFTLANERTLLAWIRTGLALLAGGVALSQFVPHGAVSRLTPILATVLVLVSMAAVAGGMLRWRQCQQAISLERPLPSTYLPWMLAGGVLLSGIVIVSLALFFRQG